MPVRVFIVFSTLAGGFVRAADEQLSVDEIVNRTNRTAYYQGRDGSAKVLMTITDSQGRTRTREFAILRRDDPAPDGKDDDSHCGNQKFYVYFSRPADVNKMVFMVHKNVDREDERYLYLPALDLVKRIAATEKRTSFVGSDFLYEDVSGRNINDDTHELVETSQNYYVLKNTPKDPASVEFSHFKMWIHKTSFIPVKGEYYDKNGDKYREYSAEKVETVDGFTTVTKARMSDLKAKSATVIEYSNVKYNVNVPDDVFTERFLRKPPREFLR